MHFLRGTVLLAALIAVPGAAVCWNWIPKPLERSEEPSAHASLDSTDSRPADIFSCPIDAAPSTEAGESVPAFGESGNIKRMGGTDDENRHQPIPVNFSQGHAVWAAQHAEPLPKTARQTEPQSVASRSFPLLENRLKHLGAKYYRLEKWGDKGELFRFSCYVSASSPNRYQKHFQAIGPDELLIMENVIMDIERWKNE